MTALVVGVLVLLAIAAVLTLMTWFLTRREQREDRAVDLQTRIAERLRRDPALRNLRIDPVAQPPIADGPMTIELVGALPSPELRARAREIAEREAQRLGVNYRVDDRLTPTR